SRTLAILKRSNYSLSTWQTILDVVGYLLTNLCRVEKLLLDEWVFGFFSQAPILCRLVPEIVRPSGSLNLGPKPTVTAGGVEVSRRTQPPPPSRGDAAFVFPPPSGLSPRAAEC